MMTSTILSAAAFGGKAKMFEKDFTLTPSKMRYNSFELHCTSVNNCVQLAILYSQNSSNISSIQILQFGNDDFLFVRTYQGAQI